MNKKIITLLCVFLLVFAIVNTKLLIESTTYSLSIFCFKVLPLIFPCSLLINIINKIGVAKEMFRLPEKMLAKLSLPKATGYFFFSSLLTGYPVGAKSISDAHAYGQLSTAEAENLYLLCSVTSPSFAIGTIGVAIIADIKIGLTIYFCVVFATFTTYLLFKQKLKFNATLTSMLKNNAPTSPLFDSVNTMLIICGYLVIFNIVGDFTLLSLSNFLNADLLNIVSGFFEMTKGSAKVWSGRYAKLVKIALITFISSFNGLSIIFQSLHFMKAENKFSFKYLAFKAIQASIAVVFSVCLYYFLNFHTI